MKHVKLDIDNKTIIRVMAVAVAFWVGLHAVILMQTAITWLIIAIFLALALNPPVSNLAKKMPGNSRALATGISYVLVLSILGFFLANIIPPLVSETKNLVNTIPQRIESLQQSSGGGWAGDVIAKYQLEDEAQNLAKNITAKLSDVGGPVVTGIGRVTSSIVAFLSILVLTFFMLVEGPQWLNLIWSYYPPDKRKHHQALARRMYNVITSYVNGQLLIATIAGLTSLVVMALMRIPNAIGLAGIVTLTGLIPMIGASLGAIIVVAVALFQSVGQALVMLVFFVVYQQIENITIQPIVQSKSLDISPLLVFIAVIVGVQIGGLLGGFIAIPLAACLRILALDYAKQFEVKKAT